MNVGETYMRRERRVQGLILAALVAFVIIAAGFLAIAWYVDDRQEERDRRAAARQALLSRQARHNLCVEIEKLKTIQREPLADEVAQTEAMLRDPRRAEALDRLLADLGFTREQLDQNLARDKTTLTRLKRKECT